MKTIKILGHYLSKKTDNAKAFVYSIYYIQHIDSLWKYVLQEFLRRS